MEEIWIGGDMVVDFGFDGVMAWRERGMRGGGLPCESWHTRMLGSGTAIFRQAWL